MICTVIFLLTLEMKISPKVSGEIRVNSRLGSNFWRFSEVNHTTIELFPQGERGISP